MVITFILWSFGTALIGTALGIPASFTVPLFIGGGVFGVVATQAGNREQEREYVRREARKQERQAHLTADTVSERQVRQELGEWQ